MSHFSKLLLTSLGFLLCNCTNNPDNIQAQEQSPDSIQRTSIIRTTTLASALVHPAFKILFGGAQALATENSETAVPTIVRTSPLNNASNVAINVPISLAFSENIHRGIGNIDLYKKNSTGSVLVQRFHIPISPRAHFGSNIVTIHPSTNLLYSTQYFVKIDSGAIKDMSNKAFAGIANETTLTFTTVAEPDGSDTTAPTLMTTLPRNNASNVAINESISLAFSENIQRGSGYIQIYRKNGSSSELVQRFHMPESAGVAFGMRVIKIIPSVNFLNSTQYFVKIDSGAIKDMSNNAFAGIANETTLAFSTVAASTPSPVPAPVPVPVPAVCQVTAVPNGTVGSYPGCVISCNAGYHLVDGSCVQDQAQVDEQVATTLLSKILQHNTTDCFNDQSVNACLFFKNPLVSHGGAFSSIVNNSMDLSSSQNFGVNIDSATTTTVQDNGIAFQCLENSTYTVATNVQVTSTSSGAQHLSATRLCASNADFKAPYHDDTHNHLAGTMAHYYLNLQRAFMKDWVGNWFGEGKNTNVYSFVNNKNFDNNASFVKDPTTGTGFFVMGAFTSGLPAGTYQETALSAEAYLHEAGHANVFFASNPIADTEKNISCGTSSKCCKTQAGCYGALNEGLADYHALIIFPQNPSIGDSMVNSANGFNEFGVVRNYSMLSNLTAAQAYGAPGAMATWLSAYNGEIHVMGRIWASIWFEARKKAQATIGNRAVRSLDRLFSAHLLALTGNDDFHTACQKVETLAGTIDGGLVQQIITDECTKRGF